MTTTDNAVVLAELDPHDKSVREDEGRSIEARWEFGQVLMKQRVGKQLPRGLRADIAEHFHLEASEITRRMQLAEKFATVEEVVDACTRCCGSWRRMIREELIEKPRRPGEVAWGGPKKATLKRWLEEVNGDDTHHAELLALLRSTVRAMTDAVEVAA